MTPSQPLSPLLRLIEPLPVGVVRIPLSRGHFALIDPIPCGEATELEPLAVIERSDRHAWDAWDTATMTADLDPLQPMPLDVDLERVSSPALSDGRAGSPGPATARALSQAGQGA